MPIIPDGQFETGDWLQAFPMAASRPAFDNLAVEFLTDLSGVILKDREARAYPDLVTFGYFCRKANLKRMRAERGDCDIRRGWGTVLHIAPANIPINFAFSLVFGLLAGNSNIVRLPSRVFPQNDVFMRIFGQLMGEERYAALSRENVLVQTARGSNRLKGLVHVVDGLVVWGGDATVSEFRSLDKRPRCVEVYFPDRTSSAVINAQACLALDEDGARRLAKDFYNDTYLVDQNACSSPSIVFWTGEKDLIERAKLQFWHSVEAELSAQSYKLDATARIDRMLDLMEISRLKDDALQLNQYSSDIWALEEALPTGARLRFGQFAEIEVGDVSEIARYFRPKEQTLTYFGFDGGDILKAIGPHPAHMVDRIVPVGRALDIGAYWDGKDVVSLLSRRIQVI